MKALNMAEIPDIDIAELSTDLLARANASGETMN